MINGNQNQGGLERELNNQFQKLKEAVGQKVKVDYVLYGSPHSVRGTLKSVEDYVNIKINKSGIPFIGYGCAIQRITDEEGNVLYKNPKIPDSYNVKDPTKVEELVAQTFGQDIADKRKKDRIRREEILENLKKV